MRAAALLVVAVGFAGCSRTPNAADRTLAVPSPHLPAPSASFRPASSAAGAVPTPSAIGETPQPNEPLTANAARELLELRKAAKACPTLDGSAACGEAATLAYAFGLAHCGPAGIERDYTYAWASKAKFAGATLRRDTEGQEWYVGAEHATMLARLDEVLYSEGDWTTVELHLTFEAAYFDATEVSRVTKLKAELEKTHMPLALGFFYRGVFRGAFDYYGSLKPNDGGMLHGNRKGALEHPLCKQRERRELPSDLRYLEGQWAPLY